jgi:hypothetical protein
VNVPHRGLLIEPSLTLMPLPVRAARQQGEGAFLTNALPDGRATAPFALRAQCGQRYRHSNKTPSLTSGYCPVRATRSVRTRMAALQL